MTGRLQALCECDCMESGRLQERQRIITALRAKAEARNIFEALEYPYLITELEETIMEGQHD